MMQQRDCAMCKDVFRPCSNNQTYCSPGCRFKHKNLIAQDKWLNKKPINPKRVGNGFRQNQLQLPKSDRYD